MQPEAFVNKKVREYHLKDIIGRGGMGAVYKAVHTRLKAIRAIKILKEDILADPHFKARFEREARILAQLENEHLIRVYEFFEEENNLFLVMEFVRGDSMSDRLELYKSLSPVDAVNYIKQACTGLSHAHQQGIVHRDLSPDNLMITKRKDNQELIKVIDFGIAKAETIDDGAKTLISGGLTVPGIFIGKIKYCSPEQAMGKKIDHRSDQYSLALILYEAITGAPAFQCETPMESLTVRLHEPPPKLSDVRPGAGYPSALEEVINRALQKDPDDRYPDVIAFRDDLEKAFKYDTAPDMTIDPNVVPVGNHAVALDSEAPEELKGTEIGPLIGLTDIFEDFKEAKKPIPWAGTGYSGKAKKPAIRKPVVYKPPRSKKWLLMAPLILAILFSVGWWKYRLSDQQKAKFSTYFTEKFMALIEQKAEPTAPPKKKKTAKKPNTRIASGKSSSKPIGQGPFLATRAGVVPPKLVSRAAPVKPFDNSSITYPQTIKVQAVILRDGHVGSVDVLKEGFPQLDKAAMDTVKKYKFEGGTMYGKPADIILDISVTFSR